jgi:ankyrin repeat protein
VRLLFGVVEQKRISAAFLDAIRQGNIAAARNAITQGVDVNIKDQYSVSALHHAASSNMVELGGVLLDHGADINSRDLNHWTPLHAASIGGHLEVSNRSIACCARRLLVCLLTCTSTALNH